MGFFLLGRGRELGELRLIAEEEFSDRQSALDALSKLSSATDYAHADADVFVVDLDTAMPVLLVAPAATPMEAPAPAEEPAPEPEEPAAGVWETPVAELESPAEPDVEPVAEPVPVIPVATVKPEPEGDLAGSLRRAADSLESEGITAPESVAATAYDEVPAPQPPASIAPPEEAPDSEHPEPELPPTETEPELPVQPAEPELPPLAPEPELPVVSPEPELPAPAATDASWPWEAPAATADDAEPEFSAPKPVIMGSYMDEAEPPAEVPAETSRPDDGELDSMLADLEPIETVGAPVEEGDPVPASDEAAAPVALESPAREAGDGEQDLSSLTCDDCVYVNTCPNKEGLEPSSCGTFQWKSI